MSQPADRRKPAPDGWGADASRGAGPSSDSTPLEDSSPGRDSSPLRDSSPDETFGLEAISETRSSKPRKRITLRISAAALELPSDGPEGDSSPPRGGWDDDLGGSAELALPPDLGDLRAADEAADPDDGDARDGWGRSRPTATVPPPPPVRTRSELPPPPKRSSESTESLRLVSARSRPTPASPPDLAAEMNDRFALGDFTGALRAAELLLGQQPNDVEAAQVAKTSRDRLVHFHLARLGGLVAVLDLKVAGAEVRWLGLDHRAGFLLSLVDGTTTVEEIVDMSGMPKHEALRLLAELLDGGAVTRIA
jgi:hypothetical protein